MAFKTSEYRLQAFLAVVVLLYTQGPVEAAPTNQTSTDVQTSKVKITVTLPQDEHGRIADSKALDPTVHEIPYVAAATLKNCTIMTESNDVPFQVKSRLGSGVKLIRFHLHLSRDPEYVPAGVSNSSIYKPFYWVRSTGRHGTGLLLLRHEYDVLSLGSLGLGVEDMDITLVETPRHCMRALSPTDVELLVRELVMNDFHNTSSGEIVKLQPTDSVCNMHVTDNEGTAEFRYICCQRNERNQITCNYLYEDFWLSVLMMVTTLLKILVILYSPMFVPDSYYRLKHVAAPYTHKLIDNSILTLNTVLTKTPELYENVKTRFKISKFRQMPNFKTTIMTMTPDVPYSLTMNDVCLRIKADRLLPEDYCPVGLPKVLYDSFVKCKIRERSAVAACCAADVFMKSNCKTRITWYRLMRAAMQLLALFVLAVPWILRIWVYFRFEHTEMEMRKTASVTRGLNFYFPGNVTLYLTPLHLLFVIIYILLTLESCIYGVIKRKVKEQFKFVMRKCFRDMRERDRMEVIGWAVSLTLKPCTKFGILGIVIGFLYWTILWPVLILILAFYMFPTLNLTVRLLAHFVVYLLPRDTCLTNNACCRRWSSFLSNVVKYCNMETIASAETLERNDKTLRSGSNRIQQLIVILLCLISLYSVIFLLNEFVSFAVEIFVYTMMGIILNAGTTLTYVSLFLLLAVYAIDVFGYVGKKFLAFNKVLNTTILALGNEKVEQTVYTMADNQQNAAFRVRTERQSVIHSPVHIHRNEEGYPRWKITRLALFLSKNDVPLIPKKFFFDACNMSFYAVPGELLFNYIRAAAEFGMILIFLLFVLIVVLAFGDTYELSATNKLLATVAGGFMPFMLRKVIFKSHTPPTIDTSSINFQVCLNDLLDKYVQTWPIFDIFVTQKHILESHTTNKNEKPSAEGGINGRLHENGESNGGTPGHGDTNNRVPETPVFSDEIQPFISEQSVGIDENTPKVNVDIDLLIDITEVDSDEFPYMVRTSEERDVGSTSFLANTEYEMSEQPAITVA